MPTVSSEPPQPLRKHRSVGISGFKPSRTALTAALVVVIGLGSANSLMYKTMYVRLDSRAACVLVCVLNAYTQFPPKQVRRIWGEGGLLRVDGCERALHLLRRLDPLPTDAVHRQDHARDDAPPQGTSSSIFGVLAGWMYCHVGALT